MSADRVTVLQLMAWLSKMPPQACVVVERERGAAVSGDWDGPRSPFVARLCESRDGWIGPGERGFSTLDLDFGERVVVLSPFHCDGDDHEGWPEVRRMGAVEKEQDR